MLQRGERHTIREAVTSSFLSLIAHLAFYYFHLISLQHPLLISMTSLSLSLSLSAKLRSSPLAQDLGLKSRIKKRIFFTSHDSVRRFSLSLCCCSTIASWNSCCCSLLLASFHFFFEYDARKRYRSSTHTSHTHSSSKHQLAFHKKKLERPFHLFFSYHTI